MILGTTFSFSRAGCALGKFPAERADCPIAASGGAMLPTVKNNAEVKLVPGFPGKEVLQVFLGLEKARSIAVFAETSANEAISEQKNPELLKLSVQDLSASVDGFEQSHPELVQIVNRICTTLSNLGI